MRQIPLKADEDVTNIDFRLKYLISIMFVLDQRAALLVGVRNLDALKGRFHVESYLVSNENVVQSYRDSRKNSFYFSQKFVRYYVYCLDIDKTFFRSEISGKRFKIESEKLLKMTH